MTHPHRRHRSRWITLFALPLIAFLTLTAFSGCFRHRWHDAERLEKKMNWVVEDVADDLEIRADQRPAYDAFTSQLKEIVRTRLTGMRTTGEQLNQEFGTETPDPDRVAAILKEHVRQSMTVAQKDALIDEFVSYYKTLDSEQQATVREKIAKKLDHHF
ncbi:MAG: Spy/CpxP family protein refolding chaperone [bacterium]